jgi:hypothetical protein
MPAPFRVARPVAPGGQHLHPNSSPCQELAGDAGPQTKADASRKALIKKKCALSIEVLALKRELSDEKRACEDLRKEMSKKDAASGRKPRHPRKDA